MPSSPLAARTLTSPGAPVRAEGRPSACLHDFVPWRPRVVRCTRCGLGLDDDCAAWYRRGIERGRLDAWAAPPGRLRPSASAAALALALGVAAVGLAASRPPGPAGAPPGGEHLRPLGDALAAAGALDGDVAAVWGRLLGARCGDGTCRALAAAEAASNRAATAAAASAAEGARRDLEHALDDARACELARLHDCPHAAVAERHAAVAASASALRAKVTNARLSHDRAAP